MRIKGLVSNEETVRRFAGATQSTARETQAAWMYERFLDVARHLQQHGHGGKIICPLPPNMSNDTFSRLPGIVKNSLKNIYFGHLNTLQCAGLIPKPPQMPPDKALVKAVLYIGNPMDEENAFMRCSKWPVDWLHRSGYLAGDSRKYLEWDGLPRQVVGRSQVYRVEFEIQSSPISK